MRSVPVAACLLGCAFAAQAATPKLFGVPTEYTSPSGYVFGVAGVRNPR